MFKKQYRNKSGILFKLPLFCFQLVVSVAYIITTTACSTIFKGLFLTSPKTSNFAAKRKIDCLSAVVSVIVLRQSYLYTQVSIP